VADLYLRVYSFADFSHDRVVGVGAAFDAHPSLRPVKVGGDPARIPVGDSMAALIERSRMPIDWLTVRGIRGQVDYGEISLLPGRGSYGGTEEDDGWHYSLFGNSVELSFDEAIPRADDFVAELEGLFCELAVAMDGCYGFVVGAEQWGRHNRWRKKDGSPFPVITRQLPNVFWLNYFGRAFLNRWPRLADVPGARPVGNGGVVIKTTPDPWPAEPADSGPYDAAWKTAVLAATGTDAYMATHGWPDAGLYVPTIDDHLAACPGTMEMPWERKLQNEKDKRRARRHARAHEQRVELAAQRATAPALASDPTEWSANFDTEDWLEFHRKLKRRLRGDLSDRLGTVLEREIQTAPLDAEDSEILNTTMGTVRIGWFMDDIDAVDIYIAGPPAVIDICESLMT
jgi:hypothetical protein